MLKKVKQGAPLNLTDVNMIQRGPSRGKSREGGGLFWVPHEKGGGGGVSFVRDGVDDEEKGGSRGEKPDLHVSNV